MHSRAAWRVARATACSGLAARVDVQCCRRGRRKGRGRHRRIMDPERSFRRSGPRRSPGGKRRDIFGTSDPSFPQRAIHLGREVAAAQASQRHRCRYVLDPDDVRRIQHLPAVGSKGERANVSPETLACLACSDSVPTRRWSKIISPEISASEFSTACSVARGA